MKRRRSKKTVEEEEEEAERRFQNARRRRAIGYPASESESSQATQLDSESTLPTQWNSQGSQGSQILGLSESQGSQGWVDSQFGIDQSYDSEFDFMGPLPKPVPEPQPEFYSQFPSTSDSSQWITPYAETRPPPESVKFLRRGDAEKVVKEAIKKKKEDEKKKKGKKDTKGKKPQKSHILQPPSVAAQAEADLESRRREGRSFEVLADEEDYQMRLEDYQGVGGEEPRPVTNSQREVRPWQSRANIRRSRANIRRDEEDIFSVGPSVFKRRPETLSDESVDEAVIESVDEAVIEEVTDYHFLEELSREKLLEELYVEISTERRLRISGWTDLKKDIMLIAYLLRTDEEPRTTVELGLDRLNSDELDMDFDEFPSIKEYFRVLRELAVDESEIFIQWMWNHYRYMDKPRSTYETDSRYDYFLLQDDDRKRLIDGIKKKLSKDEQDAWQDDYEKFQRFFGFSLLSDYYVLYSSKLTPANLLNFQRASPQELEDKYDELYDEEDPENRLIINPIFFSYVWVFLAPNERDLLVWFGLIKDPVYHEKLKSHKTKKAPSPSSSQDAAPSM